MPREPLQLVIRILILDKFVPMSIKRQKVQTELKVSHESLLFSYQCVFCLVLLCFFRPCVGGRLAYYFGKWQLMVSH